MGFLSTTGYWIRVHSPQLLLGAGIASGIATVVTACVATTKAGDILDKHNGEMEQIEKAKKVADPGEYTEEDIKKDHLIVWGCTIRDLLKIYWPSLALGTISITCTLAGYKVISARYSAATAALTLTQDLFSKYRDNVIKDVGVEKDREYLYSSKIVEKVEDSIDSETGEKVKNTVKEEYIDIDVDMQTGAIRVFGEYNPSGKKNPEWDPDIDICLYSLRAKENIWNDVFFSGNNF